MTKDEIIEMAKRVVGNYEHASYWPFFTEELQHFAKLVAAKEREAAEERVVDLFTDMETPYLPDIIKAIRVRGEA